MYSLQELCLKLVEINAIKFGKFVLKSGIESPIYIDLRTIISHPSFMRSISELLWKKVEQQTFELVCGVPYTALPLATCISVSQNIRMLMKRKEAKTYGTKQTVEGCFNKGQKVLIIEDVLTSGSSILETANSLRQSGLIVEEAVVFVDREQGGIKNLASCGITVNCVVTIGEILDKLLEKNILTEKECVKIKAWMLDHSTPLNDLTLHEHYLATNACRPQSYSERATVCNHPLTKKLLNLMCFKKSNLCVAIDYTHSKDILELTDKIGPYVVVVKVHADIVVDFSFDGFVKPLCSLASKHDFIIFEDRKFADIGNTVKMQYSHGLHRISEWAHLVTAYAAIGPSIVSSLKTGCPNGSERGCLLIAEMSCEGNTLNKSNVESSLAIAEQHKDFVVGFISQSRISTRGEMLHFTPGVSIDCKGDLLGQRYVSPESAVIDRGADVLIVGRGITAAKDCVSAAREFQARGFNAYESRVGN